MLFVCNEGHFVTTVYLFKTEPFYLNYCDHSFFYTSTHCSLMLTTLCLRVNVVRQGFWNMLTVVTCKCTKNFFAIFLNCGIFVLGFWHIWKTVRVCVRVEVKMYIRMKLNQTFTSSLSVCVSSWSCSRSSFGGFEPSQLVVNN